MDDLSDRLSKLGDAARATLDAQSPDPALQGARRRWVAGPVARSRTPLRVALVAIAAALAVALFFRMRRPTPISFEMGSPAVSGTVGQWVAASTEAPLDVRFSEGTRVRLAPGARVRVEETTSEGAALVLERGRLEASMQHRGSDTSWLLRAGPFQVRVTGTRFEAGWDPSRETFEVKMLEGSVVVTGPFLPADRRVVAGERLLVSVRDGRMELSLAGSENAPAPIDPAAQASNDSPVSAPPPGSPGPAVAASNSASQEVAPRAAPSQEAATPAWQELAAAGRYREAVAAAERSGFAQQLERGNANELLALGDASRLAGRPEHARDALLAARRRFGVAGSSSFLLGKIAADQLGAKADAARWFETYLREEPRGALAEEALGRLLELKENDRAAARPFAERYLKSYPGGSHAELAQSLVKP